MPQTRIFPAVVEWLHPAPGERRFTAALVDDTGFPWHSIAIRQECSNWQTARRIANRLQLEHERERPLE